MVAPVDGFPNWNVSDINVKSEPDILPPTKFTLLPLILPNSST